MSAGQMGFKTETTYGTAVTVDVFHPGYLSDNPVRQQDPLTSRGHKGNRYTESLMLTGPKTVSGPFNFELFPVPLTNLLRHMFGTGVTTTGAGPYTHTVSPGAAEDSFTAQVGIYGTGGTVHPFTYSGCKLTGWNIAATQGEIARMGLDVIAQDYVTGTALASASYGSGSSDDSPFTFVDGSVSVAGSTLARVTSFNLEASFNRRVQHYIGSALIKDPVEQAGERDHLITVETDFEDLTLHALANTEVAVVLTFDNGNGDTLTITTNSYVLPDTPTGPELGNQATETFRAVPMSETADSTAIEAVLVNGESSAA